MRGSKPALTHGQALGLHPICVDRKEGCRLSLAMSRCPLGVATATFDFPTTPFQGRGGCRRRHQGWVCPVVRGVESGLMDGATGSVGHGGHLQIFFIMLPRAAFAQRSGQVKSSLMTLYRPSKASPLTAKHPLKPEADRSSWNQQRITEFLKGKRMHEPVWITRSNVSSNTYLIGRCLLLFKNTNCRR